MANSDEEELAELVWNEMSEGQGYVWWKGTLEDLIGRKLDPTEANRLYDQAAKRAGG